MKQVNKFYLASFLKNQIYFVPIIVLFFQDLGLSYAQIFWIFTIGAAFSFLIEIPTGVFADVFGNRKSIIISKLLIFIAFIFFGLANGFVSLLIANLIYELGKSFRSGTETAYVYNYLAENKNVPTYTKIKINQKFYARISESLAALFGALVAYKIGFSFVFYLAAIPALINFWQTLSWEKLSLEIDDKNKAFSMKTNITFIKEALFDFWHKKVLMNIVFNISLFVAAFAALNTFVQPYMKMSGLELQYFGLVYSAFLILVAFVVKLGSRLEEKIGSANIMNYSGILACLPLIFLALGANSVWMIGIFFFVLMIDNFRSPVANNLFHENVSSHNRATMGSILQLVESVNKLWFLPVIGYLADLYSIKIAILIIALLLFINAIIFPIGKVISINSTKIA